ASVKGHGMAFSRTDPYFSNTPFNNSSILSEAQTIATTITDKVNWVPVSGYFTPADTVNYISIGVFYPITAPVITPVPGGIGGPWAFACYYYDDVSLYR